MQKIVLCFPSKEAMAEFVIHCKVHGNIDNGYCTITGAFDQECIDIAINQYQAKISEAPDFIIS